MSRPKQTEKTCLNCLKPFNAFTTKAKFCCDGCRVRFHLNKSPYHKLRAQVLQRDGNTCVKCGVSSKKVVVKGLDPHFESVITGQTLCYRCAYGR